MSVSSPVAASITHRQLTGSLPPRERANTTRRPSGETVMLRGSPNVSRCVRAYWRGNVSSGSLAIARPLPSGLHEDLGVLFGVAQVGERAGDAVDADRAGDDRREL